jgi:hypothetical protein
MDTYCRDCIHACDLHEVGDEWRNNCLINTPDSYEGWYTDYNIDCEYFEPKVRVFERYIMENQLKYYNPM